MRPGAAGTHREVVWSRRRRRQNSGVPMPPISRAAYERDLAAARAQLGSRRFDDAWAAGAEMSVNNWSSMRARPLMRCRNRGLRRNRLSQREREVVALLARGYTNRQIAEELVISGRTADGQSHISLPSSACRPEPRPPCGRWSTRSTPTRS